MGHENFHRHKPGQRPPDKQRRPQPGGQPGQQGQQQQGGGGGGSGGGARAAPKKPQVRVNEDIRAREVRAILPDGTNQVLPLAEALSLARGLGLDLVEVAGTSSPVVAKVADWKKMQAEKRKAEEEAAKKERLRAKLATPKEIQLTSRIADHDLEIKMRKINEFLDDGLKVMLVVKHRRDEGGDASSALEYLLERLAGERPGLEISKRTVGSRSVNATVWWPPAVAKAAKGA